MTETSQEVKISKPVKKEFSSRFHRKNYENHLKKVKKANNFSKRSVFTKTSSDGYIIKDHPDEVIKQKDIILASDIGTATKRFSLELDHGPYCVEYSRNGRFLALLGKHGHIGAMDWFTKKILFEFNVREICRDIKFLHQETMIAIAQKEHVYIYDKQGVELHCMKKLFKTLRMEFLPYHFLLACATEKSYLSYLDITTGEIVADFCTNSGRLDKVCQNPSNGVILTGHTAGSVSMWIPSSKKPVIKLFSHESPINALAVNLSGEILATSAMDNKMKIWDLRQLDTPILEINMHNKIDNLRFSQKSLLACSSQNLVQIYRDIHLSSDVDSKQSYLQHFSKTYIRDFEFCPYEDVLGIGSNMGFETILVPGAAEANYDTLEENPFQSLKSRQEREVRRLLDKIPMELINVSETISKVDTNQIEEEWEKTRKALLGETDPVDGVTVKHKKKGRSKPGKLEKRKQIKRLDRKMLSVNQMMSIRKDAKFSDLVAEEENVIEREARHIDDWKKPSDAMLKNKALAKKKTKNALDLLIPPKRNKI